MKALPYFRWFPADAIADEKYRTLNDAELGLYHRCLDHAWLNGGIPANLDELAALFNRSRSQLQKIWPKVSRCWYESNGRLLNRRQEDERAHAIEKSEANRRPGNANAKKANANAISEKRQRDSEKTRSNRQEIADGVLRASESESVYVSSVLELPIKQESTTRAAVSRLENGNGNRPKESDAFVADRQAAWEWLCTIFTGELKPDWDAQIFVSVIEGFEDLALLKANLPKWMESRKWRDGFGPTAENFLKKRQFRSGPPILPLPTKSQSTIDRALALVAERVANGERPL